MKFVKSLLATTLALAVAGAAHAAVSPDQAARLGTTLTGRRRREGGQRRRQHPGLHRRADHTTGLVSEGQLHASRTLRGEKPKVVITGKNAAQYADKLTVSTAGIAQALSVAFASRSIRLTAPWPCRNELLDNTVKNAIGTKSLEGGEAMENALPGVPFPIPNRWQ